MRFRQTPRSYARLTERFGQSAVAALMSLLLLIATAQAQAPGGPPSVGVVKAAPTAITESSEFIGRIQAI